MASAESIKIPIFGKDTIFIGRNFIPFIIADLIKSTENIQNYAVITDSHIADIYLENFTQYWNDYTSKCANSCNPRKLLSYVISPGETTKSYSQKNSIEQFLFSKGFGRDTCLIAFGGGVVGDLVGYVASTFMRGVPLIQIPTTLLSMVDSSIGGKNGINTPAGKNLIGTFWQPLRIYINLDFLRSLPQREISNGMAEIIKAAVVSNNEEFLRLESQSDFLWAELNSNQFSNNRNGGEESILLGTILSAIKFKADIVSRDERESGLRELLNFGHTIGHGIEAILAPKLLHGECISIGMCQEAEIAVNLGKCSYSVLERLRNLLELYKLPTSLKDTSLASFLSEKEAVLPLSLFMSYLSADKKARAGQKKIVLLSGIGTSVEPKAAPVSNEDILIAVAPCIRVQNSTLQKLDVSLAVPGSKSISNRALLLAALGNGPCNLDGLLHSEDTKWMTIALRLITNRKFTFLKKGNILNVHGSTENVVFSGKPHEIYLGNCGTAARFLTSVSVVATRDSGVPIILTGNKRMKERPIGPLVDALQSNGADIDYLETPGCLPIKISPALTGFSGGVIRVSAKLSSQYVSSLLMAAPYARKDVTLELVGDHVSSQPYIDITLAVMESFGVKVKRISDRTYLIPVIKPYTNPFDYVVEGDASSATYPLAVAAITGNRCIVTNLGSKSLQGDAQFAKLVLEPMGCKVEQNDKETIVKGPPLGTLKAIPKINMETMTDAFLTASVLAAVAPNVEDGVPPITTIVGIANTRVKECDRIAVMVEQLKRFGVETWETEDGLQIRGSKLNELKPIAVDCYEDHRVAMSFSVLGTVIPGTIILDKHCVIKSWPGWWSALTQSLKIPILGLDSPESHCFIKQTPKVRNDASVVLVGMKKAGKTTMGKFVAAKMNFKFIDIDDEFVSEKNMSIFQFTQVYGWEPFRNAEADLFLKILRENLTNTIIATGGGVVERKVNYECLKDWIAKGGLVIHIDSDWESMKREFEEDLINFIPYSNSETFLQVALRRAPLYQQCSNFQLFRVEGIQEGEKLNIVAASRDLERLIQFTRGELESPIPPISLFRSFFLCLAVPDIRTIQNDLPIMINGFHAVEIRIDHLKQPKTPINFRFNQEPLQEFENYVALQLAVLRKHIGDIPIIYTVRTKSEGGEFPDDMAPAHLESLYRLGIRLGCEFIDVQKSNRDIFAHLNKGQSKIISSYHQIASPIPWDESSTQNLVRECQSFGDIIKLVGRGSDCQNNRKLEDFLNSYYSSNSEGERIPLIAINMGGSGQPSRLTNRYLTPATHQLLPNASAPGQLTLPQIMQGLTILGQICTRQYFIFGHEISYSKSPLIHNTVFRSFGLPHNLCLFDSQDVGSILEIFKSPSFHGACVTIPYKEKLLPIMDVLSEAATSIGAINTIIRNDETGLLHGDNTDWIGIRVNIQKAQNDLYCESQTANQNQINKRKIGLVLGAGGTSRAAIYALHKLGFSDIFLYNRTKARMNLLIADLSKSGLKVLGVEDLAEFQKQNLQVSVVVDTCPAIAQMCTPEFQSNIFSGNNHDGIVVRLAYSGGSEKAVVIHNSKIIYVNGVDILIDQAIQQSKIWTGLRPSRQIISDVLEI